MSQPATLDEVLFAFHQAVDIPGPGDVALWTKQYPQFADEIRAHAVEIIDMEALASAEPSSGETTVAKPAAATDNRTLREIARAKGTTLADFAEDIGLSSAIVADVNTGRIRPETVTQKFKRLTADYFKMTIDEIASIIAGQKEQPALAMLKSKSGYVQGEPVTWEEAVLASDMDEEDKTLWLPNED
ncbi:helix-turn-helix domain-containing protein [Methylobacterium aerolatum]|uniref:Transcriptional regulator with XRE-family HTH domain n=1 Tax=Methylobacterium aerolatum TaxID=418708 RepID=A0ABU0I337_9HYPH|nr:helix-turn-helix transcriptional regulator [Methylobacterium aerolatum]MDQ0448121.1 transcriptional regulator with XRE-family HTH domain [Methylobacterium aerolatum]GJD34010.1 hypothetical protein FMGBMHLM_0906 [Methylobacterium aerolatum]